MARGALSYVRAGRADRKPLASRNIGARHWVSTRPSADVMYQCRTVA
ncbi:hypothetical protein X907_1719 [Glycocaulis alkaliphilus]|uniref:Uncharacterized protein n=1 Tax=Glycocaulis alkaliphilus TaxID=1434191 RepID=A0A3T0EAE4_9PROT|nr:hypothetical protein X907_1719 [Glycocaulis alkaliphilus]